MANPTYVSNRVLKLNIGFLLTDGPAHSHTSEIDFPAVQVADDLRVKFIEGTLRLSRTKEGVLVQAQLHTALDGECYRCLDPYQHPITLRIEELYAMQPGNDTEFFIGDDGILDLAPLLRGEIIIEADYGRPFRPDDSGVCRMCGVDIEEKLRLNEEEDLDPRLAVLKKLLDSD